MITTINSTDFHDAFSRMNRENNFSYEGREALFGYLEQLEEDMNDRIELDVIGLCCEYSEYENLTEFWQDYDKEDYPDLDTIRDHTQVIYIDTEDEIEDDKGAFIIQQF